MVPDFKALQRRQYRHDLDFHPDILALSVVDRLKHMTLHQAKYAARLLDGSDDCNTKEFERLFTDVFIICLATANTLLQDLSSCNIPGAPALNTPFKNRHLLAVGQMAKACESIDHLEDFPYRRHLSQANLEVARCVVAESERHSFNLTEAYCSRLDEVERNSPFNLLSGA